VYKVQDSGLKLHRGVEEEEARGQHIFFIKFSICPSVYFSSDTPINGWTLILGSINYMVIQFTYNCMTLIHLLMHSFIHSYIHLFILSNIFKFIHFQYAILFILYRNPEATRDENIYSGVVSLIVVFLVLCLLVMPNGIIIVTKSVLQLILYH